MASGLPRAFSGRTDEEDIRDDVASALGTTMAQRAAILEALCRMAAEQIAQHPDPQRALDWQDPVSDQAEALWSRLRFLYAGPRG